MQGMGDSGQGFANAIIFVIFTKNIRDSFFKCICCGKRDEKFNNIDKNHEGQSLECSCENSHSDLRKADEASSSLVFGSIGSSKNHKLEYSGQYGTIN